MTLRSSPLSSKTSLSRQLTQPKLLTLWCGAQTQGMSLRNYQRLVCLVTTSIHRCNSKVSGHPTRRPFAPLTHLDVVPMKQQLRTLVKRMGFSTFTRYELIATVIATIHFLTSFVGVSVTTSRSSSSKPTSVMESSQNCLKSTSNRPSKP